MLHSAFSIFSNTILYRSVWPIALALTIIYSSGGAGPQVPIPGFIPTPDKIAHLMVFGLLSTLLCRLKPEQACTFSQGALAIILTSLFGISDELHQATNPERYLEIADWLADTIGAFLATVAYQNWTSYRNLLEKPLTLRRRKAPQTNQNGSS